jgi:hypothetical protein
LRQIQETWRLTIGYRAVIQKSGSAMFRNRIWEVNRIGRALLAGCALLIPTACSAEPVTSNVAHSGTSGKELIMKIQIQAGNKLLVARLEDNVAARKFAAQLPLTLTLRDYASTEKIADLPKQLDTDGTPAGIDPEIGDLTYYAPWGNLALFYRDFGYSPGLIRLGRIEGGAEAISALPAGPVRIEAIGPVHDPAQRSPGLN